MNLKVNNLLVGNGLNVHGAQASILMERCQCSLVIFLLFNTSILINTVSSIVQ